MYGNITVDYSLLGRSIIPWITGDGSWTSRGINYIYLPMVVGPVLMAVWSEAMPLTCEKVASDLGLGRDF